MSSSEEKAPARSNSLGWFPKLVLWAAVIGFGYVYLSSVDQESGQTSATSVLNSLAKLSPVPIPGLSDQTDTTPAETAPTPAATTQPPAAKPVATSMPYHTPQQPPVSYAAAALKAPAEPAQTTAPAPVASPPAAPQMTQPLQPAPAAPAPQMALPQYPQPLAPQAAQMPAPVQAPAPTQTDAAPASVSDWAAKREQQRAEMMAQHEAMRREAEERMRQYWGQMREAMPMPTTPYGHPGYAPVPGYMPGYAPGYGPGVYAPPAR